MTRLERLAFYKRALERAGAASYAHLQAVQRTLAKSDLFFLLLFILKRHDINRDWLYARCNEVQATPNGHLDLWAREHYKSTIITFAKTIQDILNDPEITVGLFSHTRPNAKGFLRQIKNELANNVELKELFPDILWDNPERDAPKWSEDDGLVVKRSGNPKESTLEAWGLAEGLPTSKHFRGRVYDDVIDQKSVTNPDMIRKVTTAWELSLSLGMEGGWERYVGTRYHFSDPYQEIISRGAAAARMYPCTVEGTWPGTPVLMSLEELRKRRQNQGLYTFGAQMLQDPTADRKQGFRVEWLNHFSGQNEGKGLNKYLLCDPANEKKRESDYTAIGVIGLGADNNYYLLDAVRDRLSLKERGDAIFSLHRRWRPNGVGYEKYGMQSDIEYLQERMGHENYRFNITALGGQLAKADRIRRMVPIFEGRRFFLPETLFKTDYEGRTIDLVQSFIEEEYKPFPVGLHDDIFDMIARIVEPDLNPVWPKLNVDEDRYSRPRRRNRGGSAWAA